MCSSLSLRERSEGSFKLSLGNHPSSSSIWQSADSSLGAPGWVECVTWLLVSSLNMCLSNNKHQPVSSRQHMFTSNFKHSPFLSQLIHPKGVWRIHPKVEYYISSHCYARLQLSGLHNHNAKGIPFPNGQWLPSASRGSSMKSMKLGAVK